MKRFMFFIMCLQLVWLQAQAGKGRVVTMFDYPGQVETCEENFENLFTFVPEFVDDESAHVDMLSYRHIGDVRSVRQVRRMQKHNFDTWPAIKMVAQERLSDKGIVAFVPDDVATPIKHRYNVKEAITTISRKYVKSGFRIYQLRYVINLVTYEQYVFVNPETKKVVTEGNFWGFDISPYIKKTMELHEQK